MASADLLFSSPPLAGSPVNLVFGATDVVDVPPASATLNGTLPALTLRARLRDIRALAFTGALPSITLRAAATYVSRAARPTVGQVLQPWQIATHGEGGIQSPMQRTAAAPSGMQTGWTPGTPTAGSAAMHHTEAQRYAAFRRALFEGAARLGTPPTTAPHQDASRSARISLRTGQQQGAPTHGAPLGLPHQDGLRDRRQTLAQAWQEALRHLQAGNTGKVQTGRRASIGWQGPFQQAMRPGAGRSVLGPTVPPFDPCYLPSGHLLFADPWTGGAGLVFVCERHGTGPGPEPGATVVVPVRKVYVTINTITLHRVDTGAELRAYGFSMSLDYQSWTWSWSASLHNDAAAHLGRDAAGDPAELAVLVNSVPFRLRLERTGRDRRFGGTRWAVSGRGKASVLGSDEAPRQSFQNTSDRTAQQLMADVLTVNGVPLGWTVEWGLADWLVPAGAWAMQGSYIDAINDIAGAVGGYVQPHATAATLRVLPRYPLAPWQWGTIAPDLEIPANAAEVEGIQYIEKPAYNRVYIGGVGAGVFGPFTRAGTAGNVLAPPVNHALITHADAHRQRGIAEISDTGKQQRVTLSMQVLPETGVITPGKFLRYLGDTPVLGIVRKTAIDWSLPRLRQTVEIETHV